MNDTPVSVTVESTPNPRSRKFVVDRLLCEGAATTYRKASGPFEAGPLIAKLLALDHITDLYVRGYVLTITQDGTGSWYLLEELVTGIIRDAIDLHDPAYTPPPPEPPGSVPVEKPPVKPSPQLEVIREILDETITPYLQSHGGAIDLLEFDTAKHRLVIFYEGACGTCPSSFGMTLAAVQNLLRDQYDPQIRVSVANDFAPEF